MIQQSFQLGMFVREVRPDDFEATLLFVHGLGESGLCFEHLLTRPELAHFRLLVPDMPGYGRSPWAVGEALSLENQADHLAAWIKEIDAGPVTVVGHSLGGVVGLLMAERHVDLVERLVDVDGNKSLGDCVFSSQAADYDLHSFVADGFDTLREAIYEKGIHDGAQRGYYASLRLSDPAAYHLNSLELVKMSRPEDMARRLANLPQKSVYIAGVPAGACPRTHELLVEAGVEKVDISPSGHWPFIDQVDEFLAKMAAWLG